MSAEMRKLAEDVERGMVLLRDLPPVAPRPECVARVAAAVVAEAERDLRRRCVLRWSGLGAGAAAVVLLALGAPLLWRSWRTDVSSNAETVLSEWAAALDASQERFASLFTAVPAYDTLDADVDRELDELLRGLDESLRHFENL